MKKQTFDIPVHSIILIVGPTNSGKTTFCNEHLIPQLRQLNNPNKKVNVQYLSSDDIRRDLIGIEDAHKYDNVMMHSSKQAFEILDAKLRAVTSYPINAEFVVVDTKGLADEFREDIRAVARQNNYNVVPIIFDYKKMGDYYKFIPEESDHYFAKSIQKDVRKLRKEALAQVSKKKYGEVFKITDTEFSNIEIVSSNFETYKQHFLPFAGEFGDEFEWIVVGDVHGCLDEFKELVGKHFHIYDDGLCGMDPKKRIVSIGDIIDKGPKVRETIEFFYKNWKTGMFFLTTGNHENWVYKYLRGDIPTQSVDPDLIDNYFDTVHILREDEELRNKFFELVEGSKSFYIHRDFVLTHAPCKNKYIGKLHGRSLKNQQHVMYPKKADYPDTDKYIDAIEEFFNSMK